ncbi:hypothetical protein EMIT0P176_20244 [Pseudomonas sp. IT-P176]
MPGAADPLQEPGNRARRGDLADQFDVADVDPQFQRRSGDQHLQLAALESLLGIQAKLLGQAAVVRGHRVLAQAFAEVAAQAFGQAPGVDEDQGGAVLAGEGGDALIDQLPDIVGHHCRQRHGRHFDVQVPGAGVADVDDVTGASSAHQEPRHRVDGLLRGRQADAQQRLAAQRLQALQAQGQVAAALAGGHGVDFIDDHRAGAGEHSSARVGAEQHVERFRGGHQNVRRAFTHRRALLLRGIAGAHRGTDLQFRQSLLLQLRSDAGQRGLQVELDVVGQRLEGRDVDHPGFVRQLAAQGQALPDQVVDDCQKRGEGLAGAGGRGNQGRAALADQGPRARLGGSDRREGAAEPGADGGVKAVEDAVGGLGEIHGLSYATARPKLQVRAQCGPALPLAATAKAAVGSL